MANSRNALANKVATNKFEQLFGDVDMGKVAILENFDDEQDELKLNNLLKNKQILTADNTAEIIESIKQAVVEMVQNIRKPYISYAEFLSAKLKYDYSYLANLFSEAQGSTIEKLIIFHRVKRVKELINYSEYTPTEIAIKMQYISVLHLTDQYKKVTGSPLHLR